MKKHKVIMSLIVLIGIASGLFLFLKYSKDSQRQIGTDSGYSYSIEHSLNEPDFWTISTPDVTRFTLSRSTISDRSYEVELQEYKKSVDELIRLEKSLKWRLVFLSNTKIHEVAKGSSAEARKILGARYSNAVVETCKEIVRVENRCEQIFMSIDGCISR